MNSNCGGGLVNNICAAISEGLATAVRIPVTWWTLMLCAGAAVG